MTLELIINSHSMFLKEPYSLDFDQYFSFIYFLNIAFVGEISLRYSGVVLGAAGMNGLLPCQSYKSLPTRARQEQLTRSELLFNPCITNAKSSLTILMKSWRQKHS